jgi:hypothetical protein
VFGGTVYKQNGYVKPVISNNMLEFKRDTNFWEKHNSNAIPVTGHASVVIHGHMYVFFGYNDEYLFLNKVQKLNLCE